MTLANAWLPMTEYQLVTVGSSCFAYSASRSVFEVLPITCSNCACVYCCTTWLMKEELVTFGPPCCGCATAPAIMLPGLGGRCRAGVCGIDCPGKGCRGAAALCIGEFEIQSIERDRDIASVAIGAAKRCLQSICQALPGGDAG